MALKFEHDHSAERYVWLKTMAGALFGAVPFLVMYYLSGGVIRENSIAPSVLICGTIIGALVGGLGSLGSVLSAAMKRRGTGPGKIGKMTLEPDEQLPIIPPPRNPNIKERPEPVRSSVNKVESPRVTQTPPPTRSELLEPNSGFHPTAQVPIHNAKSIARAGTYENFGND